MGCRTDVPALGEDDSQEEDEEEDNGAGPAVGCERGRGVEIGLELLWRVSVTAYICWGAMCICAGGARL